MRLRLAAILFSLATLAGAFQVQAQTITTGDLAGTITDPSGAVVPNATVVLKSLDEGSTNSSNTNSSGYYHFSYLKPGNYSVTANAPGFQTTEKKVVVALGASPSTNFQLTLGGASTTIEVTGAAAQIETEDANLTANFSSKQLDLLPNPDEYSATRQPITEQSIRCCPKCGKGEMVRLLAIAPGWLPPDSS